MSMRLAAVGLSFAAVGGIAIAGVSIAYGASSGPPDNADSGSCVAAANPTYSSKPQQGCGAPAQTQAPGSSAPSYLPATPKTASPGSPLPDPPVASVPAPTSPPPVSSPPSPSPASPESSTATDVTTLTPDGVPASLVGPLELADNGAALQRDFASENWGAYCDSPGSIGQSGADLALTTTGQGTSCAQVVSPSHYTYGIFEARVDLPAAANGDIANWPAFWLDAYPLASWPAGGEWDLMEGLAGQDSSHYIYGGTSTSQLTVRFPTSGPIPGSGPGWHTITGVWGPGTISEYVDGTKVFEWDSSHVVSTPMSVVLSMDTGALGYSTGQPATMLVSYVRVWGYA